MGNNNNTQNSNDAFLGADGPFGASDLFTSSPSPGSSGSSGSNSINATQDPETLQNVKRLSVASDGLLYEDDQIQVGIQSMYKDNLGQIKFFYGNKTGGPLDSFNVSIDQNNAYDFQFLDIESNFENNAIQPASQVQQIGRMTVLSSFGENPVLRVRFVSSGKPVEIILNAPIVVTKFLQPKQLNSADFFKQWKQLDGLEEQQVFASSKPIDIDLVKQLIGQGLNLTVLQNVDPNPANLVGAAVFVSQNEKIDILLRLEINTDANMYRLTVRAQNMEITKAVTTLAKSHLE